MCLDWMECVRIGGRACELYGVYFDCMGCVWIGWNVLELKGVCLDCMGSVWIDGMCLNRNESI